MPELPEVESYRRLAERTVGRRVGEVQLRDRRYLRGGTEPDELQQVLHGAQIAGARRIGKLLVLDLGDAGAGRRLGVRFGMTGRLQVDDQLGVDRLLHASDRLEPAWQRFAVRFTDGGLLAVHDPRLLGGVSLDPDEAALGPDAATVTPAVLARALQGSTAALKSRLLDQSRLAGVGNLLADEILWRASLAPARPAGSLSPAELRRLHRRLHQTLVELLERGGSHLGELVPHRTPGGRCPRDGGELRRATVGGRTTWWCPTHQR